VRRLARVSVAGADERKTLLIDPLDGAVFSDRSPERWLQGPQPLAPLVLEVDDSFLPEVYLSVKELVLQSG